MGFDKTNISGDSVSGFEQNYITGNKQQLYGYFFPPEVPLFRQELHL
jgi:hypothetical protein